MRAPGVVNLAGLSGIGAYRGWVLGDEPGCGSQPGDLVSDGESSGHFGAMVISGEPMAAGAPAEFEATFYDAQRSDQHLVEIQ